jgi:hypothetical protein
MHRAAVIRIHGRRSVLLCFFTCAAHDNSIRNEMFTLEAVKQTLRNKSTGLGYTQVMVIPAVFSRSITRFLHEGDVLDTNLEASAGKYIDSKQIRKLRQRTKAITIQRTESLTRTFN